MHSTTLAPNPDHLAAALSFRRARNALIHAKLSPWTRDRELDSLRFWRESAEHHRSMAAFNSTHAVRTWDVPNWREEVNWLMRSRAAVLAGVE